VRLYNHPRKIAKIVILNLQVIFAIFVIYSIMNSKEKKYIIVKNVEYVELEVEKTFFIVKIVNAVFQLC